MAKAKEKPKGKLLCKTVRDPRTNKRVYFYGHTEREINQKIMNYTQTIEHGRLFKEVAADWWEIEEPTLELQTRRGPRRWKDAAIVEFGEIQIKKITSRDVQRYLDKLAAQGYALKTVANARSALNGIFKYALLYGDVDNNPVPAAMMPKGLKKGKRTAAGTGDEEKIKASAGVWPLPAFALYTGMRKGEILALRWQDIDFDAGTISVTKAVAFDNNQPYIKEPKTESGVRTVPLLDPLREILSGMKGKKPLNYIFSSDGGKSPMTHRAYYFAYKKYKETTGVTATLHQLRHSFATIAFEYGVPVKTVQNILGHAQFSTTMDIYTDFRKKAFDDAADILNAAFSGKNGG